MAALASAAVPGWGQIRTGRARLGRAVTLAFLVSLSATVAAVFSAGWRVVTWAMDPEFLLILVVVDLLLAVVRVWATADAWTEAGGSLTSVLLVALVVIVLAAHAVVAYYGLETRSTLRTLFPVPAPVSVLSPETTTASAVTTTVVVETASSLGAPAVASNPASSISSTTVAGSPLGERVTLLILGGDAGPDRTGLRTDTIMVATVDTATGDAALFGLARNMGGFTFSDGTPFPGLSQGLLNEVYQWGRGRSERFSGADPGAAAVMDVASDLLGLPIDHYLLVDMVGFAEMIDTLGGVEVQVPRPVPAPLYDRETGDHTMITVPAGSQWLDGDLALAYVRSRTGSSDYSRMTRQRCLLSALVSQVEPLDLFAGLPTLLDTVKRRLTTDVPLSEIPFLIDLAGRVDDDRVVVVGFDPTYRAGYTPNGLWAPDVAKIQATVRAVLSGRYEESGLSTAGSSCR